ncbi:MAG: crossover junction endodeoxyribonuclease RuvC [Alphaproteobacteria bacterium]|jgi:crossover junction endodeoxyribonuclease RuvC|nr:crossover junction endodeoxyribonuclease RuvC [Alphaproteobacteria bacterium]MDP7222619.1 crossover junction endodeoxyribonuclease RuvC [Alphaproteobacteria bacterium]
MRILGIDPGLTKMGWGLIESRGSTLSFVDSGLIRTNTKLPLYARLAEIDAKLSEIVHNYQPDTAAIEETFVNKNPASALKLGMARGVAMTVPARYGLDVGEYGANHIKKSVVGTGHAAKDQMGMMIKTLLPQSGKLSEDEADALAVAICHAHHQAAKQYKIIS